MKKNKPVGLTQDSGYEIGARRTFPVSMNDAWDFLMSEKGLEVWLGNIRLSDLEIGKTIDLFGIQVMMRLIKPYSHLRMTWIKDEWRNASMLQLRVIKAGKKATIIFHQDQLLNRSQREEMKEHWEAVLNSFENIFENSKTLNHAE